MSLFIAPPNVWASKNVTNMFASMRVSLLYSKSNSRSLPPIKSNVFAAIRSMFMCCNCRYWVAITLVKLAGCSGRVWFESIPTTVIIINAFSRVAPNSPFNDSWLGKLLTKMFVSSRKCGDKMFEWIFAMGVSTMLIDRKLFGIIGLAALKSIACDLISINVQRTMVNEKNGIVPLYQPMSSVPFRNVISLNITRVKNGAYKCFYGK